MTLSASKMPGQPVDCHQRASKGPRVRPYKPIDPSVTETISRLDRSVGMIVLICSGLLLVSLSALTDPTPPPTLHIFMKFIFWCMIALSVLMLAKAVIWTFFRIEELVTLSPTGITDLQISKQATRWSEIQRIGTFQMDRKRLYDDGVVLLEVTPEQRERLTYEIDARIDHVMNKPFAKGDIWVNSVGIAVAFEDLLTRISTYARARNPSVEVPQP